MSIRVINDVSYKLGPDCDLRGANLAWGDLSAAHLYRANLEGCDLRGANLSGATLEGANLQGANLRGAILVVTNMIRANLKGADLTSATIANCALKGANLTDVLLPAFQIPQDGTLTVWKKARGNKIVKLLIPDDSRRTASLLGRKCRTERAKVLSIVDDMGKSIDLASSMHHFNFKYKVGEYVIEKDYDDDIRVECAAGIHFFLTKEEAEKY